MNRRDPLGQAEEALRRAQKKAAKAQLLANFEKFVFEAHHIERRRGEEDWTCRIHAKGPKGQVVRNLSITVKTPSPLDFDRTYDWALLSICPLWVDYYTVTTAGSRTIRFSLNTSQVR